MTNKIWSIASKAELDAIRGQWPITLEPARARLTLVPREVDTEQPDAAKKIHVDWWQARIARQKEIDDSIAAKAKFEYLYDKPYADSRTVRVAGPFTVESLSPHRVLGVDENDELIDPASESGAEYIIQGDAVMKIFRLA